MNIFLCFSVLFCVVAAAFQGPIRSPITQIQRQFAIDLLRSASKPGENSFISPASISIALAMTYAGADGETGEEIAKVLSGVDKHNIHRHYGSLSVLLNNQNDNYTLSTANRAYLANSMALKKPADKLLRRKYRSKISQIDFADSEVARAEINGWVSERTHDLIKDLIGPNQLNEDTLMVLVNAIYLKANWSEAFNPDFTKDRQFNVAERMLKTVSMMTRRGKTLHYSDSEADVVGLPFKGGDLTFFAILPKERHGLQRFVENLDAEKISSYLSDENLVEKTLTVALPKFELAHTFGGLVKALQRMGINQAFDQTKANFTKFADHSMHIGSITHKAVLKVNENGCEAAAATGIVMGSRMGKFIPDADIVFDHPFTVLIVHNRHCSTDDKEIMFAGNVVNPIGAL